MIQHMLIASLLFTGAIRDDASPIVDAMAGFTTYSDRAVGYAGTKPASYTLYERLAQVADDEDLLDLLDHRSAVVRLYAFQALVYRGVDADALPLRGRHELVATRFGCMGQEQQVEAVAQLIVATYRFHTTR